jgi:amidohydrolase
VAGHLSAAGWELSARVRSTGLVFDLAGQASSPRVALRADLDALLVAEQTGLPFRSQVTGVSHACGHDVHTAVVTGAGLALARLAEAGELPGAVRLLFQPAEEVIPGGALALLESGALDEVQRVFALHCDPRFDAGTVALRPGPMTGATDSVLARVRGPGGHTARPQLTVDVVTALADIAVRTPAILSRRVDPRAGLSLVWGLIAAGSAHNVIPKNGEVAGTVRVLDPDVWRDAEELVARVVTEVAEPYGGELAIEYVRGVPPAVNDPDAAVAFQAAAGAALGPAAVLDVEQSMGGEDFGWMLQRVPGVLARLGVRRPGVPDAPDLHRGDFSVDEAAIGCGIRALVAATLDALR